MGIPFTLPMGFLLTVTMGFLLTIALAIQLTISTDPAADAERVVDDRGLLRRRGPVEELKKLKG